MKWKDCRREMESSAGGGLCKRYICPPVAKGVDGY